MDNTVNEIAATHPLNFEIPEALWQKVKTEADRLGISVSAVVKITLAAHFDNVKEKTT